MKKYVFNPQCALLVGWSGNAARAIEQRNALARWRRSLHRTTRVAVLTTIAISAFVAFRADYSSIWWFAVHAVISGFVCAIVYFAVGFLYRKQPPIDEWNAFEKDRDDLAKEMGTHPLLVEMMPKEELQKQIFPMVHGRELIRCRDLFRL